MTEVVFRAVLDLPTSVNASLVPTEMRGEEGRRLRLKASKDAKAWKKKAHLQLLCTRRPTALRKGLVSMRLDVHVPTIASDGGNRLKLLEDALVRARVLTDDRQIVEWAITTHVGEGKPRVEVELRPADPSRFPEFSARLERAENKAAKVKR
jgi:Holliday junction resolvase RusA-like endonuclease